MNFFTMRSVLLLAFVYATARNSFVQAAYAVIKEPVVDLYIDLPLHKHNSAARVDGRCHRAHQLLYNEVVRVIATQGHAVQIACDNVVYSFDELTGKPLNTFWVHKKHVKFFSDINDDLLFAIPGPWGKSKNILVLRLPWMGYSLGTRFVHAPEFDTDDMYGAYVYQAQMGTVGALQIPYEHAHFEGVLTTPQDKRACFVQLAYDIIAYAHDSNDKVIPYVWGGSSFVEGYDDQITLQGNAWERPGKQPYNGYDCSELILRLAQTCDIPCSGKTTTVLAQMLKPLKKHEQIENGDIIWFPGHVIIISDIARNEMIEARGYKSAYGKVQCIKLAECFRGIKTYRQLRQAYHRKRPLVRLKKDGSVENVIREFKILKLL